jgi:uncharacterized membrane protein
MNPPAWRVRLVWIGVTVLALIGIVAAARRALILLTGIGVNPAAPALDEVFARHPALTFVHLIPGVLFILVGPFQFMPAIRAKRLWQHRWSGRLFVASGYVIGASALAMSWRMSIGGANETAATTLFALLFLFSLTKAFWHIRHRQIIQHREWMLRAFGIGLGIATTRPIVGAFFATRRLAPQEFFGIAFWLGFTLTTLAAEIWINVTRDSASPHRQSDGNMDSSDREGTGRSRARPTAPSSPKLSS